MSTSHVKQTTLRALAFGVLLATIASAAQAAPPMSTSAGKWSRCELDCKNTYPDNPVVKRACIANCKKSGSGTGMTAGQGMTVYAPGLPAPSAPSPLPGAIRSADPLLGRIN